MSLDLAAAQLAGRLQQTPPSSSIPTPPIAPPIAWRHLARWVSPLVIIGLWQILSSAGVIDERTIASPAQIAVRAVELDPGRHARRPPPWSRSSGWRSGS